MSAPRYTHLLLRARALTCAIANLRPNALPSAAITVPKHAKVPSLEAAQRDLLDHGRRDGAQQQEHKSDEEYYGQRRGRS